MPRSEQDRGVRAIAAKLPVRDAFHVIPSFEWHSVNASNLVIRSQVILIQSLEGSHAKNEQIELIRLSYLQIPQLQTDGDRALTNQLYAFIEQICYIPPVPGVVGTPVIRTFPDMIFRVQVTHRTCNIAMSTRM